MTPRTLLCGILLTSSGLLADSVSGWTQDKAHPDVSYRFRCRRDALTIEWRNGYPGNVTMKVNVKGSHYDGGEDVVIPANGSASSSVDTFYCFPDSFSITEKAFSMAPPVRVQKEPEDTDVKPPAPAPPTVAPWVPPLAPREVSQASASAVQPGMKRDDLLKILGQPNSQLTIPEDSELVQVFRYAVAGGASIAIRLSNGVVTAVTAQQP